MACIIRAIREDDGSFTVEWKNGRRDWDNFFYAPGRYPTVEDALEAGHKGLIALDKAVLDSNRKRAEREREREARAVYPLEPSTGMPIVMWMIVGLAAALVIIATFR